MGSPPPISRDHIPFSVRQSHIEALEQDLKRNFTCNVGKAIETLRDEVPLLLREAPTLDIYSEDVILSDPNGQILRGKNAYSVFFASLRMARRLSLTQPVVEIKSLRYLDWKNEICVRFSVELEGPLGMDPIYLDAISVYRLNSQGLIAEHRIDDVTRLNLFQRPSLLTSLPRSLVWGGVRSPMPVPAW